MVNFAMVVRKIIFERTENASIRIGLGASEGIFLFPDLKSAEMFRAEERKGRGVILECSTTSTQTLQAAMNLISNPDLTGT